MPEFGKNLPGNFPELPSPREVVEANFQVAQRLLEAQRDFTSLSSSGHQRRRRRRQFKSE